MADKPEIRVGQVYRDKDKRDTRFIKIGQVAVSRAWCVPCVESGQPLAENRRSSYVLLSALQTRFELVKDVSET